jgi:ABC-type transport system involved in multi-copper enzyme maturation permease subunit
MSTFNTQKTSWLETKSFIAAISIAFASVTLTHTALANSASTNANLAKTSEATYNYLPIEVVQKNIQDTLLAHQIDASGLEIQVDDKGVVNASGHVASKEEADNIVKMIQANEGVYAVFGRFVHP